MEKYEIQQLQSYNSKIEANSTQPNESKLDSSGVNDFEFMRQYSGDKEQTRKKYGNIKVLLQTDRLLFTLGPDWICFFFSFIFFIITHFTVVFLVSHTFEGWFMTIFSICLSIIQSCSYLFVSLSNPGIETRQTLPTDQDSCHDEIKRFCKKCGIRMQQGTFHCRQCDVCIRQYDHHCPWVSKCIGQKNLKKFYFFVMFTMFYLIYCVIMVLVCVTKGTFKNNQNLKNKTF